MFRDPRSAAISVRCESGRRQLKLCEQFTYLSAPCGIADRSAARGGDQLRPRRCEDQREACEIRRVIPLAGMARGFLTGGTTGQAGCTVSIIEEVDGLDIIPMEQSKAHLIFVAPWFTSFKERISPH